MSFLIDFIYATTKIMTIYNHVNIRCEATFAAYES